MDSNHRSEDATDLQSAPIGHSGTLPYSFFRRLSQKGRLIIITGAGTFVNPFLQKFSPFCPAPEHTGAFCAKVWYHAPWNPSGKRWKTMYQYQTLENTSYEQIAECFRAAFSDYYFSADLSAAQLQKRLEMSGVDLAQSYGAFQNGRLVGFLFNTRSVYNGQNAVFDAGTGVVPEHRENRCSPVCFSLPNSSWPGRTCRPTIWKCCSRTGGPSGCTKGWAFPRGGNTSFSKGTGRRRRPCRFRCRSRNFRNLRFRPRTAGVWTRALNIQRRF